MTKSGKMQQIMEEIYPLMAKRNMDDWQKLACKICQGRIRKTKEGKLLRKIEDRLSTRPHLTCTAGDVCHEIICNNLLACEYMADPTKQNSSELSNMLFYVRHNIPFINLSSNPKQKNFSSKNHWLVGDYLIGPRHELFNGKLYIGKPKQSRGYSPSADFLLSINKNIITTNKYLGGIHGHPGGALDEQVDNLHVHIDRAVEFFRLHPDSPFRYAILLDGPKTKFKSHNKDISVVEELAQMIPDNMDNLIFAGTHDEFFDTEGKYESWI